MRVSRGLVTAFATLGAVAGAGLVPGAAFAAGPGLAWVSGYTVLFTAGKPAQNNVVLTRSGHSITIVDRVAIRAGDGCARVGGSAYKVRCTTSATPTWMVVDLGDQDDKITSKLDINTDISGGAGKDTLLGGPGPDGLWGDSGNDVVRGGAGRDSLAGGAGNDALFGDGGDDSLNTDPGADTIYGGGGFDTVYYDNRTKPVTVDIDGVQHDDGERGERDSVEVDVEGIVGGSGADRLSGNNAVNKISGGAGNDVINGFGGNDVLIGQSGDDRLFGGAGSDYLVGEYQHRVGGSTGDNPAARDRLDGGSDGPFGDICAGLRAATLIGCEYTS